MSFSIKTNLNGIGKNFWKMSTPFQKGNQELFWHLMHRPFI
uniref:Uncharacterized protein n=1 Tax=Meloidogyne enterolobii TaxID=390850 RepID=A0A6V7UIF3_MELEN|nr:unnamed protein product [Meloidogyne enterolobii]